MHSNNIQFKMPSTESPMIKGTNSSEFETFQMNKNNSLVREEIQNSLDVIDAEGNNDVTKIDFCTYNISPQEIPCHKEYIQMFKDNEEYWDKKVTSEKSKKVFRKINHIFSQKQIRCLRISDYNQTGLTQENIDGRCSPYESLVFGEGVSDKASGSGGSHGLGKNAAYTSSETRTVIYSTINKEKNALSIGVVKAPSYKKDKKDYDGCGFFCAANSSNFEPTQYLNLDKNFDRAGRIGTDKHIIAYNPEETIEEINKQITIAVLNNFFPAIVNSKLIVNCNNSFEISNSTIASFMNDYEKKEGEIDKTAYNQYMTMQSPDKIINLSLFEENDVICYFRQHSEGSRRVAIVRRTGMKIFDQKNFPSGVLFDGLIHIVGEKANDYFKQFENGEHNAWRISEIKKNTEHKKYYDMLLTPIRDMVKECQQSLCGDSIDIEGVSDFLPEAYIKSTKSTCKQNKKIIKETLTNEIESSHKMKAKKCLREKITRTFVSVDENGIETVETVETVESMDAYNCLGNTSNKTKNSDNVSVLIAEHAENGINTSHADSKSNRKQQYFSVGKKVKSEKFTVKMRNHKNGVKLLLNPLVDVNKGFIEIKFSGETASDVVRIKSATINGHPVDISNSKDKFKIKNFKASKTKEINIDIDNPEKLAVEVYLYENT